MGNGLKPEEVYKYIENYSVKCRLYLNELQRKIVDDILYGIRVAYNTTMYDMRVNHNHTNEWTAEDGSVFHFPDFASLQKKEYLDELRAKNPIINTVPAVALSGKNGIFSRDMRNAFEKCYVQNYKDEHDGKEPPKKERKSTMSVEKAESNRAYNKKLKNTETNDKKPKKKSTPSYYSKSNKRMSYTYQDTLSKFKFNDNANVMYANLSRLGLVKIRGFNQRLRFQSNNTDTELATFEEYCMADKNKKITITISKDNCGDYFIILRLNAFKPVKNAQVGEIGVDVGEKTSATLSNGIKYDALSYGKEDTKYNIYNRQLSRRKGWKNKEFKDEYKRSKENGELIQPSNRYKETELRLNRASRKKKRRREDYYNKISYDLATHYKFVATETLSVSDMIEGKNRETEKTKGEGKKKS